VLAPTRYLPVITVTGSHSISFKFVLETLCPRLLVVGQSIISISQAEPGVAFRTPSRRSILAFFIALSSSSLLYLRKATTTLSYEVENLY